LLNKEKKEALWEYQTREIYSSARKTRKIVKKACINQQNQEFTGIINYYVPKRGAKTNLPGEFLARE
jgi:hypothetical protein